MQNWCALLCFLLFKPLHFFCNSGSLASPIRIQTGAGEESRLTGYYGNAIILNIFLDRGIVSFSPPPQSHRSVWCEQTLHLASHTHLKPSSKQDEKQKVLPDVFC